MKTVKLSISEAECLNRDIEYLADYAVQVDSVALAIRAELKKTANVEISSGLMGAMGRDAVEPLQLTNPELVGLKLVCMYTPTAGDMPEKLVSALGSMDALGGIPRIPAEDGFTKWQRAMANIKKTLGLKLIENESDLAEGRTVYRVSQDAKGNPVPTLFVKEDGEIHFN